jgi:hypothetical protein
MQNDSIKDCPLQKDQPKRKASNYLLAFFAFAIPVIIIFFDVLFNPNGRILSYLGSDIAKEFIDWRYFGFEQLKQGNLALWNPHVFCGIPFFGSFQSALLYPPNFLYMLLPMVNAVNIGIVLHILLAGLFMFLWARHRGLNPISCFFSAILIMFCGPYFMHISAGHLSNLCTMAWVPLIFLAIDGIFDKRTLNWALAGTAAVSMLILSGHPQYVFYAAVAAAIYSALLLINHQHRVRILSLLALMVIWGGLLVSVQLLTGLQESSYTVRGDEGRGFEFASIFSFPPENILTLIAPGFFGEIANSTYWGRCYIWEASVFFSVTGLILAFYGQIHGSKEQRRFCMTLIIITFILALGAHTPLFKLIYYFIPGFDKFRGNSKFIYQMIVFAVMLSAIGLHRLTTSNNKPSWLWIFSVAFAAVIIILSAGFISYSALNSGLNGCWHEFMKLVQSQGAKFHESYFQPSLYDNKDFVVFSAAKAANSLFIAACIIMLLAGLFALKRRFNFAVYGIIALAFAELINFALPLRSTFELADQKITQQIKNEISSGPGDFRIFDMIDKNGSMMDNMYDIWGDDPGILRRYAYFIAFTEDPGKPQDDFSHPFFSLLRLHYVIKKENGAAKLLTLNNHVFPRLLLVHDFQIINDRESILKTLASPDFNPDKTVVLETQPNPLPRASGNGVVKIINESTDYLTIEADIETPAILLITDSYHPNWRIKSLPGSSQAKYDLLPADYVLRAVPLNKGKHLFRMEYLPKGFITGMWISIVSLVLYTVVCFKQVFIKRKTKRVEC